MRSIVFCLLIFLSYSCFRAEGGKGGEDTKDETKPPVLEFARLTHHFGDVSQGEKVACRFTYRNAGGSDLVIHSAVASCGCTVPSFSREPLPPGGEESMEVVFDTAGRSGKQVKTIYVRSNASNNPVVLTIHAKVVLK